MRKQDLTEGVRVELHPATDAWMQGDRYGTVTLVARKNVYVRMDRSRKVRVLKPESIGRIV